MGSHRCQRPMCSGKHLLKGWMPSSVGSMESSRSKTPCAQFCPQPTVPPSPKPALPRQHCPMPRHLPLAPSWPSHWPAPLPLPPCRVPPMLVMPWWWITPVPLEWCAPVSNVARQATWSESAPSQTHTHRSRGRRSAPWKAKVVVLKTMRMRLRCSATAWSCTRERERLLLRSRILETRPSESWRLGCRYPSPLPVPVSAASTLKYTILQQRHTWIEAEEKNKKETVANEKVGPIKCLTKVLKDALSCIP